MGITSHVLAGSLGAVGGIAIGALVTDQVKEIQKKWAVARIGGISKEDAEKIERNYEQILNAVAEDLKAADITGLDTEFLEYANQLCFPKNEHDRDFVLVPKLRTNLKDDENDLVGTRTAQFEYFDSYYAAKGEKTDKYVAQVRILDNLHTLLLNYIDNVKKQPGEKYAKVLEQLGKALKILHENFKLLIADTRDVSFFNTISPTKRARLAQLLIEEDDKIIKEAIAQQRQITLVEHCNAAIKNEIKTAGSIAEFLLRALDRKANATTTPLVIAKMEKKEVTRDVTGNVLTESPIGDVVAHHMAETAQYARVEITDPHNSFNERYKSGAFDLRGISDSKEMEKKDLPSFMDPGFMQDLNIDKATIYEVSRILNYLNIVIALEEDLKNKIDSYGSKGIVSTGEFEFRRSLIESFYNQAIMDFKRLLKENSYFQEYFGHLSSSDFIKDNKSKLLPKTEGEGIILATVQADLSSYIPSSVRQIGTVKEIGVLEKINENDQLVTDTHSEIVRYVAERQQDQAPNVTPIMLNSDLFIANIAMICANDENIGKIILENLQTAKSKLTGRDESQIFQKRLVFLNENIDRLIAIKKIINNIKPNLDTICQLHGLRIDPPIDFSVLRTIDDFAEMHARISKFEVRMSEKELSPKNRKVYEEFLETPLQQLKSMLNDHSSELLKAEKHDEHQRFESEQHKSKQLEVELEKTRELSSQATTILQEQLELEKKSHELKQKSLSEQLESQQSIIEKQTQEIERQKGTLDETLSTLGTLQHENVQQLELNRKLAESNKQLEELILSNIKDQIGFIQDTLIPDIKEIDELIQEMSKMIQTQISSKDVTLDQSVLRKLESDIESKRLKATNTIENIQRKLQEQVIKASSLNTTIKSKFEEANTLLETQKQSLDSSHKQIRNLQQDLVLAQKRIQELEVEKKRLEEEARKKSEEHARELERIELQKKDTEKNFLELQKIIDQQKVSRAKNSPRLLAVNKFVDTIIQHAKSRYANDKKLDALVDIQNKIALLDPNNGEKFEKELKEHLEAFLIICMQKRSRLKNWGTETDTGKYAVKLLNNRNHKDILPLIKDLDAELAKSLDGKSVKYENLAIAFGDEKHNDIRSYALTELNMFAAQPKKQLTSEELTVVSRRDEFQASMR